MQRGTDLVLVQENGIYASPAAMSQLGEKVRSGLSRKAVETDR